MFGFVSTSPSLLTNEETARYRELYCGLCHALKKRCGQASRLCLTYDLTFYVMLCNSLHEPTEERSSGFCALHPGRRMTTASSPFTNYAADLSVALTYHKLLDDVRDDGSIQAKTGTALLKKAYEKTLERIPNQCHDVETSLARIAIIENDANPQPDEAANEFGALLGRLFAPEQGIWKESMEEFGSRLGRFVYFMDAAVDYADDERSGNYNPFVRLKTSSDDMRELLSSLMGNAAASFEKLPLEKDLHIMRSVLYSGVWQKFNERYDEKG